MESRKDRPRRSSTRRAASSIPSSAALQRLNGGKVEFAVGLHDRDVVAPLHVDRERLGALDAAASDADV